MNSKSLKKIWTVLVLLLLLANIATLALFWSREGEQPMQPDGGPARFIIHELELTKSQQEDFLALADEHQAEVRPIRAEIKQAKERFFKLLKQPNLNDSTKNAAAYAISKYTEQIDLITFDHFVKVRALCNSAQKEKFDSIIKNVTQMMAMPHPAGPPPPEREF